MAKFHAQRKHDQAITRFSGAAGGAESAGIPVRPPRTLWQDAIRRFAKNRLAIGGLVIVLLLAIAAVFADDWFIAPFLGREPQPLIAKAPYDKIYYGPSGAFPSGKYWMGTDLNGRDLWSRIVFGARISLTVGLLAQVIAIVVGVPLGAIAGWRGGQIDYLVMRLVDIMSAIPGLLLAYLIMARLGPGFWNVILAIGLRSWLGTCRLTRAQFLALREKEFVEAARMIGATEWRIIRRHLLPNALGPIIVSLTLGVPGAIFGEASLSFLGIGINPPMPSWGQMLGRDGIANMSYFWHLALFPALAIAITLLSFTLMGDGLQEALDPQSARRS
jgi:ABC-type dipeptide/oligopeptide/nickel transport system permease subunit